MTIDTVIQNSSEPLIGPVKCDGKKRVVKRGHTDIPNDREKEVLLPTQDRIHMLSIPSLSCWLFQNTSLVKLTGNASSLKNNALSLSLMAGKSLGVSVLFL